MTPFPAPAATVTQEAEIPWSGATTVSPPPMGNPSTERVVPPGDIGIGPLYHNVILLPPKETKEKCGSPKTAPRGGQDGFGELSPCQERFTKTTAMAVKSLLMTTKSNCGIFCFTIFVF